MPKGVPSKPRVIKCAHCGATCVATNFRQLYCDKACSRAVERQVLKARSLPFRCEVCGATWMAWRGRGPTKYCSDKCKRAGATRRAASPEKRQGRYGASAAHAIRECRVCGIAYVPTGASQRYCRHECVRWAVNERRRALRAGKPNSHPVGLRLYVRMLLRTQMWDDPWLPRGNGALQWVPLSRVDVDHIIPRDDDGHDCLLNYQAMGSHNNRHEKAAMVPEPGRFRRDGCRGECGRTPEFHRHERDYMRALDRVLAVPMGAEDRVAALEPLRWYNGQHDDLVNAILWAEHPHLVAEWRGTQVAHPACGVTPQRNS